MNTGLRRGELFNLRWSDIDFDRSTLSIHGYQAKSNHTRHVPLNDEAKSVLEEHRKGHSSSDFVFPNRKGQRLGNVKRSWSRILKMAKINNFRFHDLRHHFASRLVMVGVPINTVRELLGHSDMNMTLRYAHLADHHTAEAVSRLAR